MTGAVYQAEKRLTLVVYDQGVTIPASLPGWLGYDSQVAFGQSRVLLVWTRLIIPQGARLVGQYDAQIAFGQSRALLVWNRLIMPNGRSIVLERQPGADTAGYAGLEDEADNHWNALFKAALLSTLLGVGSELGSTSGTGNNGDIIQALRRGSSDSLNQTGQKTVQRNLNIQPTLTIRPGFPVRVIVNRDLVLEPYRG